MPGGVGAIGAHLPLAFFPVPAEMLPHDGGYAVGAGEAVVVIDEQGSQAQRHEIRDIHRHLALNGIGDLGLEIWSSGEQVGG